MSVSDTSTSLSSSSPSDATLKNTYYARPTSFMKPEAYKPRPKHSISYKMNKTLIIVRKDETLEAAIRDMREYHQKAAIVIDENEYMVGLITESEILKHLVIKRRTRHESAPRISSYTDMIVSDAMIEAPNCLDGELSAQKALEEMRRYNFRFMPVVLGDEICGIADMKDMIFQVLGKRNKNKLDSYQLLASFLKRRALKSGLADERAHVFEIDAPSNTDIATRDIVTESQTVTA